MKRHLLLLLSLLPAFCLPLIADNTPKNFDTVARACAARGMEFIIQYPLVTLDA